MRWVFTFVLSALKLGCSKITRGDEKGSVTIYLAVVFSVLICFVGLFADLGRIKVAQNKLRRITDSSARSVLTHYDPVLKNDFRLLGAAGNDYNQEFAKYVRTNFQPTPDNAFDPLAFRLEDSGIFFTRPLDRPEVFKQQILEAVKYKAPIEIIRGLTEKLRPVQEAAENFRKSGAGETNSPGVNEELENIRQYNRQIEKNKSAKKAKTAEIISKEREIAAHKAGGTELGRQMADALENEKVQLEQEIAVLDSEIDQLAAETESARIRIEEAFAKDEKPAGSDAENRSGTVPVLSLDEPSAAHQARLYSEIESYQRKDPDIHPLPAGESGIMNTASPGVTAILKADEISGVLGLIFQKLNLEYAATQFRDEIFVNEYALMQFSNYSAQSGGEAESPHQKAEVEYICYGGEEPLISAIGQLYLIRFALNTAGYFAFSKVPGDVLVRTLYSLVMGALEGAVDTYKLMAGGESVPVVSVYPNNPLGTTGQLNYKDHLRLLLLLNDDEKGKLARMTEIIKDRNGINLRDSYTMCNGYVEASIPMWFFPLAGMKSLQKGPFGTQISDGRCYITKYVELGY